jgi:uncharacterized membrane protein
MKQDQADSTLPVMDVPYEPPQESGIRPEMPNLNWFAPLTWLAKGLQDMRTHPFIAVFYGISFLLMAQVLGYVFRRAPEYMLTMVSGCLLVGPFMAMGLYEVSRRKEKGETCELSDSLTCWDSHIRSMAMLILVLMVLELLWGRASLVVFAVFFNTGMPSTTGVVEAIFNPENFEFVLVYLGIGSVFASLVYALAVVSIPMILDRDTDAISAAITSLGVVFANPMVMLLWGALICLLIALALWPGAVGLLLVGPWLGHASWHAYRDCVRWPDALPS